MSQLAIRLEGISKLYHIGKRQDDREAIKGILAGAITAPFRAAGRLLSRKSAQDSDQTFWALKDISFDVKHGEIVGVIGRNGAGKSTLMKIMCRITEPTEGSGEINGRVGSLLEVGTGFHPELTGRENLFLNGAILGMRKAEIERKFDEIVAFAEIDRFIDTPVKHYSSGMYVRLAFAVAAHLEPEILLVDEVLAVGDAAFQRKCLGKMSEVSKGGRTVLLISHNMAAIENLCHKGVVIEEGRLTFAGETDHAIEHYLQRNRANGQHQQSHVIDLTEAPSRTRKSRSLLRRLELFSEGRPLNGRLRMGAPLTALLYFELDEPASNVQACLAFNTLLGQRIFTAHSVFEPRNNWTGRIGGQVFVCEIPSLTLVPGEYQIKLSLDTHNSEQDVIEDAGRLTILESDFYGTGRIPWNGMVVLKHGWRMVETSSMSALYSKDPLVPQI
jgi:lipopolysaccharide transport system ATP-binding protein